MVFPHPPNYRHATFVSSAFPTPLAYPSQHSRSLARDSPSTLHAFTDAGWASNKDDYTSTMGHVIFLGCNPLTWCSKKQKGVARSSTEAEYRAIAHTTCELLWFRNLFTELGLYITKTSYLL